MPIRVVNTEESMRESIKRIKASIGELAMWQLVDNTDNKFKGWLTITKDGVRVADAFPYTAKGPTPAWVREQAQRIVDTMNKMDMVATGSPLGDSRRPGRL